MARGGAAASSSRGRGKFKVARGGGRHFSRDIQPIDQDMENLGLGGDDDDEESEESESEEEESSEEDDALVAKVEQPEKTRQQIKAEKAAKKAGGAKAKKAADESDEESGEESNNDDLKQLGPNARPAGQLSRKEKEAAEAAKKAERYRQLHAAGKTDEAKGDMARLAEVRARREAEAAKRLAAAAEAEKAAQAKKDAQKLRKM